LRVRAGIVPSFFTMTNMFCGYFSVIQTTQERFTQAAWLIVAAAVFDTIDGILARLTKTSSNFGIQYDSLADAISFGLAPSYLAYMVFFKGWGTTGLLISFLPLVFGSIRLARFNVRQNGIKKEYFEGLPIPAAALTIATFIIFNFYFWDRLRWTKLFLILLLFVSAVMISTILYERMPEFSLQTNPKNRTKILITVSGVVIIVLFPHETFFPLALLYILSGPFKVIWPILRLKPSGKEIEKMENQE
jgi:CDP-diacylglycerol---serine O-phosphatidyltransferase